MGVRLLLWLGSDPTANATARFLALGLTYSVHAVLWAGVVALLVRLTSQPSKARHLLWRMALVGPLATTTLTALLPDSVDRALTALSCVQVLSVGPEDKQVVPADGRRTGGSTHEPDRSRASTEQADRLLLCAIAGLTLGLLRWMGSLASISRRLRGRQKVEDPRLRRSLDRMSTRVGLSGVVLTASENIGSPMVVGRRELCVPATSLASLSDTELDTVLAHELAHLEQGDWLWFPLAGLVQSVLWIHPLNHWVAARFRESAELASDDRAVELTGDPEGLARALVGIASTASFKRSPTFFAVAARSAFSLRVRVRRLMATNGGVPRRRGERERAYAVATVAAIAAVWASLTVGVARAHPTDAVGAGATTVSAPSDEMAYASPESAPDAADLSVRIAALAGRERELDDRIADELHRMGADSPRAESSGTLLELEQERRHVRETAAWLEARFTERWAGWENRRSMARGLQRPLH